MREMLGKPRGYARHKVRKRGAKRVDFRHERRQDGDEAARHCEREDGEHNPTRGGSADFQPHRHEIHRRLQDERQYHRERQGPDDRPELVEERPRYFERRDRESAYGANRHA